MPFSIHIKTLLFTVSGDCDFESSYFCDWYNNEQDDEFDWKMISGSTGSTGTGPTSDHTTNSTTGRW